MQQIVYKEIFEKLAGVALIDGYFASQFSADLEEPDRCEWFMILVALSWHQRQGHTCLDISILANKHLFHDSEEALPGWQFTDADTLAACIENGLQHCAYHEAMRWFSPRLYTLRYWQFESEIASALKARISPVLLNEKQYAQLSRIWPVLFPPSAASEQDWQQIATAAALLQRFTIINGGPGTGKTYTVTRLLLALQCASNCGLTIQLAAPTGKAAQRMNESVSAALNQLRADLPVQLADAISTDAVTLHRLLGISRYGVQVRRGSANQLRCDVLIIDEASMIDVALMARVLRALPETASLILVGDADQLPAVESGNVLEALIDDSSCEHISPRLFRHLTTLCPQLPVPDVEDGARDYVKTLQTSRRFAGDLAEVAKGVRSNDAETAWAVIDPISENRLDEVFNNEGVVQLLPVLFEQQLASLARRSFGSINKSNTPEQALTAMQACRWLTPTRRGPFGVEQLNASIQQALGIKLSNQLALHYKGRPIMVTENNYAQRLFNGDVGIIWPDEARQLKAWFETETGLRSVSLSRLPAVETVYAMTVHKSQGSEFDHVMMIIPPPLSSNMDALNTRELLYTGLTRAKTRCTLVTTKSQFEQVVANRIQRHSGLRFVMQSLPST
ncbi:exodeoxyribonuclease V subunit alpha [Salinimonas chungwhensis]|uniref:exodeoxyribonuclease V subunit alpha n=1 Tax=Salinimonas chungwhensis TaxID=265425 RepID=UPI00036E6BB4|nr:exodeoxyribonuclease V subunit alpha [Salinimonas chungwhensis]